MKRNNDTGIDRMVKMRRMEIDEGIDRSELFGGLDRNLKFIEGKLGVDIIQRGNELVLKGENAEKAAGFMEDGPMYFPDDMVTEHPARFIVSEIIREKVLLYLQDEVPHGVAVEIESYVEEDRLTRISAVIYCERKTHKGMIIGKGCLLYTSRCV